MSGPKPRREPRRRASEAIYTAILDAGELLLVERGPDALTASAVAERAGVSPGSFYQYFPNKDAVVAAIGRRINDRLMEALQDVLASPEPAEVKVRRGIECYCALESLDVRRALLYEAPRKWEYVGMEDLELRLLEEIARFLREQFPPTSAATQRHLMFAIRGVVQGALVHDLEGVKDGEVADFLCCLVLPVLKAPADL